MIPGNFVWRGRWSGAEAEAEAALEEPKAEAGRLEPCGGESSNPETQRRYNVIMEVDLGDFTCSAIRQNGDGRDREASG